MSEASRIAALEAELSAERSNDMTPFQHPAYTRGHDNSTAVHRKIIAELKDELAAYRKKGEVRWTWQMTPTDLFGHDSAEDAAIEGRTACGDQFVVVPVIVGLGEVRERWEIVREDGQADIESYSTESAAKVRSKEIGRPYRHIWTIEQEKK